MLVSPFLSVILALSAGILLIIVLSTRYKMHPFFSLSLSCLVTGWIGGLDTTSILTAMKEGFGKIMSSLGYIIAVGTALGMVLQSNGATTVMAATILKWVGRSRSVLAVSLTGFMVGLPIFCDSGFIVLSGLNASMIRKTATPAIVMSAALATGLYAVHCFIPPHPGITSATGTLTADFGWVILYGLIVAVPAMLAGYGWSVWKGRQFPDMNSNSAAVTEEATNQALPPKWLSFIPVLVPISLIAIKAILTNIPDIPTSLPGAVLIIGDPSVALSVGLLLALLVPKKWTKNELGKLMNQGIDKAGGILVIIGAGAAFGAIIGALKIQDHLAGIEILNAMGLLFPFLVTAILKTAQGSSTVAIVTAASIVLPFLSGLGLDSDNGRILAVLAMGAGSMAVSHVNDSYFWVIAHFADLELKPMLRVFTVASFLMAVAGFLAVYVLSLFLL